MQSAEDSPLRGTSENKDRGWSSHLDSIIMIAQQPRPLLQTQQQLVVRGNQQPLVVRGNQQPIRAPIVAVFVYHPHLSTLQIPRPRPSKLPSKSFCTLCGPADRDLFSVSTLATYTHTLSYPPALDKIRWLFNWFNQWISRWILSVIGPTDS